jgi:uncharacterized tellurite resistance protein B-like protein
MFKKLINQVVDALSAPAPSGADTGEREAALRTATAVLMLDVARADHVFEEKEFTRVLDLVESHFGMAPEDAATLINAADEEAEDLTSLYDFTQLLHQSLDEDEKARIVSLLWQVAYADGALDKYEDSLVLKISDLLHVSRGRVMRLKHDAALAAN